MTGDPNSVQTTSSTGSSSTKKRRRTPQPATPVAGMCWNDAQEGQTRSSSASGKKAWHQPPPSIITTPHTSTAVVGGWGEGFVTPIPPKRSTKRSTDRVTPDGGQQHPPMCNTVVAMSTAMSAAMSAEAFRVPPAATLEAPSAIALASSAGGAVNKRFGGFLRQEQSEFALWLHHHQQSQTTILQQVQVTQVPAASAMTCRATIITVDGRMVETGDPVCLSLAVGGALFQRQREVLPLAVGDVLQVDTREWVRVNGDGSLSQKHSPLSSPPLPPPPPSIPHYFIAHFYKMS